MHVMSDAILGKRREELHERGVRVTFAGRRDWRVPKRVLRHMDEVAELTRHNRRMTFCIAFNYGGRAEIVDAVRALVAERPDPSDIDEKAIAAHLYQPGMPDPDLVIRTSGEYRISNFWLWELAYSELVFTETLWPDFRREHLFAARPGVPGPRAPLRRGPGPGGRWRSTATGGWCCAPTGWGRPTGSWSSSPRATARSGPWPRACARPRAASVSRLEPTSHVALLLYEGRELDIVTQADSIDHHPAVRADLGRLAKATALLEAIDHVAQDREPDAQLYRMLVGALHALDRRDSPLLVAAFFWKLLAAEGVAPLVDGCAARCGDAVDLVAFDLAEGGVLCRTPPQRRPDQRRRARAAAPHPDRRAQRRAGRAGGAGHARVEALATAAMEAHVERRLRAPAVHLDADR